jgi:hypothetical protein
VSAEQSPVACMPLCPSQWFILCFVPLCPLLSCLVACLPHSCSVFLSLPCCHSPLLPACLLQPDGDHVCVIVPATPSLQQEQQTLWQHQRTRQQQQAAAHPSSSLPSPTFHPLPHQHHPHHQQQQQQTGPGAATAANLSPMMLVLRWASLALVSAPLVSNLGLAALTSSSVSLGDQGDAVVAAAVLQTQPALAPAAADSVVLAVMRSGWMWAGSLAGSSLAQVRAGLRQPLCVALQAPPGCVCQRRCMSCSHNMFHHMLGIQHAREHAAHRRHRLCRARSAAASVLARHLQQDPNLSSLVGESHVRRRHPCCWCAAAAGLGEAFGVRWCVSTPQARLPLDNHQQHQQQQQWATAAGCTRGVAAAAAAGATRWLAAVCVQQLQQPRRHATGLGAAGSTAAAAAAAGALR